MISYKSVSEKFQDKGYDHAFFFLFSVQILDLAHYSIIGYNSAQIEEIKTDYKLRYEKELDYWNTWIDYQQYKF